MLPPLAPGVLDANPLFANLYTELTTRILDPVDTSTRLVSRPNDVVDQVVSVPTTTCLALYSPCLQELRTHRAELAKTQLLQKELDTLTSRAQGLPEEVYRPHTDPMSGPT
jgi:hypothetical protein